MDVVYLVLVVAVSALLSILGLLGCVAPGIPGPLLSYVAMLCFLPTRFAPSVGECVAYGVACLIVLLLDYLIPAMGAKRFNCSRWGVAGCMIGMVVGMFFGFCGLILGPFIGAMAGELVAGKNFLSSLKGGFGAFLGFVFGVLIKVVYCVVCAAWCLLVFFK